MQGVGAFVGLWILPRLPEKIAAPVRRQLKERGFLFLDGDHSYSACMADLSSHRSKTVFQKGMVVGLGSDGRWVPYGDENPGVLASGIYIEGGPLPGTARVMTAGFIDFLGETGPWADNATKS